jgi:hypothetical protein
LRTKRRTVRKGEEGEEEEEEEEEEEVELFVGAVAKA